MVWCWNSCWKVKSSPALAGLGQHRDEVDGVAAEREEVVVHADPVHAEHLAPDAGQGPLVRGARLDVAAAPGPRSASGAGQRTRGRACRWGSAAASSSATIAAGHHVARAAPRAACCLQRGLGDLARRRPRTRAARSASRRRTATTAASATAGCARSRSLDLARLDPETADLHLQVDAGPGSRVAPSGSQRARSPVRYSRRSADRRAVDEPLGGQLRPVRGSRGPRPTPATYSSPRHADRRRRGRARPARTSGCCRSAGRSGPGHSAGPPAVGWR